MHRLVKGELRKEIDINRRKKFGRLTLLKWEYTKDYEQYASFKCSCGKKKTLHYGDVRRGHHQSCGCLHLEVAKVTLAKYRTTTHGMSASRFYDVWFAIKDRCTNPKNTGYKNYGGRGITIWSKWLKFINFKNDMYKSYLTHQKSNPQTTIERINNSKGYSKSNCRWATMKEQSHNRRKPRLEVRYDRT